jgi:mRNA interferase MazF
MGYIPERGDAVWLNLDPQEGREQGGRRPVIVLSPVSYNRRVGLAIISPITNQAKGYTFEVNIPAGLRVKGVVLSDHVKSSDWRSREIKFICRLPESVVEEVIEKLSVLLTPEIRY